LRTFLIALVLAPALSAPTQQPSQPSAPAPPPAGSNWQHVQALPIGASLDIKAKKSHLKCKLKSVDADSLTCAQGKEIVLQRTDILTIKIPHRGRSLLVGAAIGGGAGTAIGFAAGTSGNDGFFGPNFLRGAIAAIFGVGGGLIGGIAGGVTDFTRSTIYKAP
jgi:hypothetical protein